MERMFPKLEDAVIRIYLDMLANAFLPSIIPCSSTFKSFFSRMTSADSLAASVSTEMPTSAAVMAERSFMPSPRKPTEWPFSRSTCIICDFWLGVSSAKIEACSTEVISSSSVRLSISSPVRERSVGMPRRLQIETATLF